MRGAKKENAGLWVDTAVRGHEGWWAAVDARGVRAGGKVPVRQYPGGDDSTAAEARGLLAALEHAQAGETVYSDALQVVKACKGRQRHEVGGIVGEICDRIEAKDVVLKWRRRSDPGIRKAHSEARRRAQEEGR